jgi:hypothetical protein
MNLIAVAAMAGVACVGLIHGLYRSAQTLVICVLAGAIAFGLLGPVSGILANDSPRSTWYYAADPFCLWVMFCAAFLLLRALSEKLIPNEPGFPPLMNQVGGLVFGALTGYLTVGICLLLVQMLPTSPELLGYEAFRFKRGKDGLHDLTLPGQPLLLQWDRGTLAFFNHLSAGALGSQETGLYRRCGDVYPPADQRDDKYEAVLDANDFLYLYWYRRWEFFFGSSPQGPLTAHVREGPGLGILQGQGDTLSDVSVYLNLVERAAAIEAFPQERPPADHDFLLLTIRFKPTGRLPRTIDSSQFYLADTLGPRMENPLVLGRARAGQPQNLIVPEYAKPSAMTARAPRFSIPSGGLIGSYLASGASFAFTEADQWEVRKLAFRVPKRRQNDHFRLNILPHALAPAAGTPQPPKPPPAKAPAAKSPPTAPAAPAPATPAPARPAPKAPGP